MFKFFKKKHSDSEELSEEETIAALAENAGVDLDSEAETSADTPELSENETQTDTPESAETEITSDTSEETNAAEELEGTEEERPVETSESSKEADTESGSESPEDNPDEIEDGLAQLEAAEKARRKEEKARLKEEKKAAKQAAKEARLALKEAESEEREEKKDKERYRDPNLNLVKELFQLLIYIGVVIIACYLLLTFVGQRTTVHGESMETTLQNGDNLWLDKLTYRFKDPQRFDIIVFPYQDEDVYYIKRIIGLPGETIQIRDSGEILINGELLDEDYGLERIADNGIAGDPITLGEDEYFVLGDNRNNSRDSRWADVGLIKRDKIIGKAVLRITPFSNFGALD